MSTRGRKAGEWIGQLGDWLADRRKHTPLTEPIPPSRELGERYAVNHTSVFRQLQRLEDEGLLWQAASGRFYFSEARFLIEKPKPVACLFRTIETWSFLYQELMEGIAEESERRGLASLLWHEKTLVRHSDPGHPPRFSEARAQQESLQRFAERYSGEIGGVILDHIWSDQAVLTLAETLPRPPVVLCRPGPGDFPSSLPDFSAGATVALTHLFALGYEHVYPVYPFPGDPSIDHALRCFQAAAESTGTLKLTGPKLSADTPAARQKIAQTLSSRGRRVGLVFLEDNNAALFLQECRTSGLNCPRDIGILSLQGTRAAELAGLTHIRTSYSMLGKRAVELSLGLEPREPVPAPTLVSRETTAPAKRQRRGSATAG
jgi:DNA-binding LacI/PurR family transcriptional regulator